MLHRLKDVSFHGVAVVCANILISITGKFDRNEYSLAVMASNWDTTNIIGMRSCPKWCSVPWTDNTRQVPYWFLAWGTDNIFCLACNCVKIQPVCPHSGC